MKVEWREDGSVALGKDLWFSSVSVAAVHSLILILLAVLDDADDDVQELAVDVLRKSVIFMPTSSFNFISEFEEPLAVKIVKKCLLMTKDIPTTTIGGIRDGLDLLVRSIATLDPAGCERVVRDYLGASMSNNQSFVYFCSDIIGHCDILAKLTGVLV
jgi:hypothetical protein